jgi:phage terminase small subunit
MAKLALNRRHQLFVDEYLVDLNATRAAIAAGYSKRRAAVAGAELVRNRKVAAEIARKTSERCEKLEISANGVLGELQKAARANMLDYITVSHLGDIKIDLTQVTREQAAAIQELTTETFQVGRGDDKREVTQVRFKLADKLRANELLGKHLKLFTDKVEHSGEISLAERIAAGRQRVAEKRTT